MKAPIRSLKVFLVCCLLTLTAIVSMAQAPIDVQKADLAVNFGAASGRLITSGDQLIFIDEDNPGASFAIYRGNIMTMSAVEDVVNVETSRPVRDRSGERTKLAFRINGKNTAAMLAWYKAAPMTTGPSMPATAAASPATTGGTTATAASEPAKNETGKTAPMIYQAERKRLFGARKTTGRLIVSEDSVSYESLDDIKDSRQWKLIEIKKIKMDNPYQIEIEPFSSDAYKLDLQGQGMNREDFQKLQDRIASARATRR
ncbi:MAG: hypothetical protein ACKV2V_17160 [Blastocatellia bacterium]